MLKGIIFDFDGTLAQTNTLILKAMGETFKELFGGYTDDQLLDCIGPPLGVTGCRLYPKDPQHFVDTYRKYQSRWHDEMVMVYPSVLAMLDKLYEMEVKLAIVTSKKRDMFLKGLHQLELEKYFDVTVTEDDVTHHKPDAEPVNLALCRMGLTAAECIMVGDNEHDILAAHAAGMKCVAVGWAIKGLEFLKRYNPDFIMHKADDIFDIMKQWG